MPGPAGCRKQTHRSSLPGDLSMWPRLLIRHAQWYPAGIFRGPIWVQNVTTGPIWVRESKGDACHLVVHGGDTWEKSQILRCALCNGDIRPVTLRQLVSYTLPRQWKSIEGIFCFTWISIISASWAQLRCCLYFLKGLKFWLSDVLPTHNEYLSFSLVILSQTLSRSCYATLIPLKPIIYYRHKALSVLFFNILYLKLKIT